MSAALPNRADVLLLMGAICYQLKDYQQCIAYNDRCGYRDAVLLLLPPLDMPHQELRLRTTSSVLG